MKDVYSILGVFVIAALVGHVTGIEAKGQGLDEQDLRPPWGRNIPGDQRFVLIFGNAAVWDRETDLIWEREPDPSPRPWLDAQSLCNRRKLGNRMGWRLPRIQELASLADTSRANPALPAGHPFRGVDASTSYWSATHSAGDIDSAWVMSFFGLDSFFAARSPFPTPVARSANRGVWCVRSNIPGTDAQ